MRTGRERWILAIALILTTALVGGCGQGQQDQSGVELEVAEVARGSIVSSITAVGTVRVGAEVVLSFGSAGRVSMVAVQEGDRVKKGQLLAQLDQAIKEKIDAQRQGLSQAQQSMVYR